MIAGLKTIHLRVRHELTITFYGLRQALGSVPATRRYEYHVLRQKCFQIGKAALHPAPVQPFGEGNELAIHTILFRRSAVPLMLGIWNERDSAAMERHQPSARNRCA